MNRKYLYNSQLWANSLLFHALDTIVKDIKKIIFSVFGFVLIFNKIHIIGNSNFPTVCLMKTLIKEEFHVTTK